VGAKILGLVLLSVAFLSVLGKWAADSVCEMCMDLLDADAEIIGLDAPPESSPPDA